MRFDYTASRQLAPGHSVGEAYSILMGQLTADPDDLPEATQTIALNGDRETVLMRIDGVYDVVTDLVEDGQPRAEFREFLSSVADGQVFTFDPDATSATDVSPVQVIMDMTRRWRASRPGPRHWQWAFRLIQV